VTNFGVEPFLEAFLSITPPPLPRMSDIGEIVPQSDYFSGFIFKIQANMNPAHRDRLAFLRIVSGQFQKGMTVYHSGTDKMMQLKQPQQFMADEREAVETAYAGDIIGLFDPGCFHLGDALSTGPKLRFSSIPVFAPEHFARVRPEDSMKRKQFLKGISQLSEEGAIQTFLRTETGREESLVGVVGVLQFEVLEHRLKAEYGVTMLMDHLPFRFVRWVTQSPIPIDKLKLTSTSARAFDGEDRPVLLFENEWSIRLAMENNPGLQLADTANRNESMKGQTT
jgi:peptide chain release factor 3